jgi:hypothetical protein
MSGETENKPPLQVVQASRISAADPKTPVWLIEQLWASQAVGLIGGAPKSCKSWLALEMALSVASGQPCLGSLEAVETGPVLLFAAEDSPRQVRARLEGLARVRGVNFSDLDVHLILEPQLRLDVAEDQSRLQAALEVRRPRLLILDPFVRLHRLDENSAADVSALLADLRAWQRRLGVAIVLVHHTRKSNGEATGGSALRGSSDLHAWGDSNLYVRRNGEDLVLCREHRWARSGDPLTLRLVQADGSPPHLEVRPPVDSESPAGAVPDLASQVLAVLRSAARPMTQDEIRDALKVRNHRVYEVLCRLRVEAKVTKTLRGWTLTNSPG